MYLIAIVVDKTQPARAPVAAYGLLAAYLAFAAITAAVIWNDWWLDARVAGPAHAIDIFFFTALVLLTESYTSPFFAFFMFVVLAAAIRWGWRATALTSILLVLLYLAAGLLVATSSPQVQIQTFGVRTGHLVILSLILIWFGASRWGLQPRSGGDRLGPPSLEQPPVEAALRAMLSRLGATSGAFLWSTFGAKEFAGVTLADSAATSVTLHPRALRGEKDATPFLYNLTADRCLRKDGERNLVPCRPEQFVDAKAASQLGLSEGLAIPIRSGDGYGAMFLEGVRGLSTDHIDLGEQLAAEIAAHLQAHALLRAADESAESRSRLTLARDLHDGVVQFLAGIGFRLEAMRRSDPNGRDMGLELDELKQLVLQEQHELRAFVTALRSGPMVTLGDLAADLRALAGRLSRQWAIDCALSAGPSAEQVPMRLHLDSQQLIREAVANAVRHAGAKKVTVGLTAGEGVLRLEIVNDGTPPPTPGGQLQRPRTLQERVEQCGGTLDMSRGMNLTKVAIVLPLSARRT